MGMLVDGVWKDVWYDTKSSDGHFKRNKSTFRNFVTADGSAGPTGSAGFKAEAGRYHLYVSYACPWAHRTLIFRKLKGLEHLVPVSAVDPLMLSNGWEFHDRDGATVDHLFGSDFLWQVYPRADPGCTGRVHNRPPIVNLPDHDFAAQGRQCCRQSRAGASGIKARGQGVVNDTARRGHRCPIGKTCAVFKGPGRPSLPQGFGRGGALLRQVQSLGILYRLKAPQPRIARIKARNVRNLGPERLGHQEAFELEGLLCVPRLGRVGCQCTDQAAAGPGPDPLRFDQAHPGPAACGGPGDRQSKDPTAPHRDIRDCHSVCLG